RRDRSRSARPRVARRRALQLRRRHPSGLGREQEPDARVHLPHRSPLTGRTVPDVAQPARVEGLRRTLSLRDLIFIVVGTVIGSGIFLTPGAVVRAAGSGGVALVAWIVGGVLSLLGALTFAE